MQWAPDIAKKEQLLWAHKLLEIVTDSHAKFEEAQTDLKQAHRFAYPERINPGEETGLGQLGMGILSFIVFR